VSRETASSPSANADSGPLGVAASKLQAGSGSGIVTGAVVTETYDCSPAPEWLRNAVKGGERWRRTLTISLKNLEDQCTGQEG
jgi:hypothetical protein